MSCSSARSKATEVPGIPGAAGDALPPPLPGRSMKKFSEISCGSFFKSSIPRREGIFIKTVQNSYDPALVNMWTNAMGVIPELGVIGFGPDGFEYFADEQEVEPVWFRLIEVKF